MSVTDSESFTEIVAVNESASAVRPGLESYLRQHLADVESLPTYRPVVSCIIPAYNEADSIEAVLRSLLKQTRPPGQIHVSVNNSSDDTFALAAKFAGPRSAKKRRMVPAAGDDPVLHLVAWLAGPLHRHHPADDRDAPQVVPPSARLPGLTY